MRLKLFKWTYILWSLTRQSSLESLRCDKYGNKPRLEKKSHISLRLAVGWTWNLTCLYMTTFTGKYSAQVFSALDGQRDRQPDRLTDYFINPFWRFSQENYHFVSPNFRILQPLIKVVCIVYFVIIISEKNVVFHLKQKYEDIKKANKTQLLASNKTQRTGTSYIK